MKIALISFSPTGGTRRCAEILASEAGETIQTIDLTDKALQATAVDSEADLALIAVPSYGGRMPNLAVERLKCIDGRGRRAVLLVVYGNRAYEDTLVELADVAMAQGFTVVVAVTAVAQHCMASKIAAGRPDAQDEELLRQFGRKIAEKVASANDTTPSFPGNRPYKNPGAGMSPTTTVAACHRCGLCATKCPAGAISTDDPTKIDTRLCIGCQRCVTICPTHAKHLPTMNRWIVGGLLSLIASKPRTPELFL